MWAWIRRAFGTEESVLSVLDADFGAISFDENPERAGVGIWQMHEKWELPDARARLRCNSIPGTKDGPYEQSRGFLLEKKAAVESLWDLCGGVLSDVRKEWYPEKADRPLKELFILSSLGLEEPILDPPKWSVGFEGTASPWLYVEVSFEGATVLGHSCDT
jgi:hypothetical protein